MGRLTRQCLKLCQSISNVLITPRSKGHRIPSTVTPLFLCFISRWLEYANEIIALGSKNLVLYFNIGVFHRQSLPPIFQPFPGHIGWVEILKSVFAQVLCESLLLLLLFVWRILEQIIWLICLGVLLMFVGDISLMYWLFTWVMRFIGGLSLLISSFSLFFNHLLFRCPRCLGVRPAWFSARLFDGSNGWAFYFWGQQPRRLPAVVITVYRGFRR